MDFNGYKRYKKIDIKKWLHVRNSKIYLVILILLFAAILFAFKTVLNMSRELNSGISEEETSTENVIDDGSNSEQTSEAAYIAENQSYSIKINRKSNFAIIYKIDSNMEYTIPVKAFYCSVNSNISNGKATIEDKTIWKKISEESYGHYATRLSNAVYLYSSPYYFTRTNLLNVELYNNIGNPTKYNESIYMTAGNAKWIYENCGLNTPVEISDDLVIPSNITIEQFEKLSYSVKSDPSDK